MPVRLVTGFGYDARTDQPRLVAGAAARPGAGVTARAAAGEDASSAANVAAASASSRAQRAPVRELRRDLLG